MVGFIKCQSLIALLETRHAESESECEQGDKNDERAQCRDRTWPSFTKIDYEKVGLIVVQQKEN